jgi:hypothetical protein
LTVIIAWATLRPLAVVCCPHGYNPQAKLKYIE